MLSHFYCKQVENGFRYAKNYLHSMTYTATPTTRFPNSIKFYTQRAKLGKREKRLALTKLYQGAKVTRRLYHPDLVKLGQAYSPKRWQRAKLDLKLARSSVNVTKSILKCSKQDARSRKVTIALDRQHDAAMVTVPLFKSYDLEKAQAKRREYISRKHTQPTVNYPDYVTFDVTQEVDDYPDVSYYGEFTNKWEPGAINHYAKQFGRDGESSDFAKWFVPCNSYESQRDSLTRYGYSRADADLLAREYVERDYDRLNKFYNGDWCELFVTVTARIGNVVLGDNSCGIESDQDIDGLIADLTSEIMNGWEPSDLEQIAIDQGLIS